MELYRGIPEEDFLKICKDRKLTSLEKNLLTDFYCNRMSIVQITLKYHYSDTQIYRFKAIALKKLEV